MVDKYGSKAEENFCKELNRVLENRNVLNVLRDGIQFTWGANIKLCYFKPASNINPNLDKLYKSNILSAHGMYISTPKILDKYMALSFNWYKNCENILDTNENIYLVKKPRFFQYLNERFSDFWFKNYTNFTTNPICMYQEKANKLSLIGKRLNEKKVN